MLRLIKKLATNFIIKKLLIVITNHYSINCSEKIYKKCLQIKIK